MRLRSDQKLTAAEIVLDHLRIKQTVCRFCKHLDDAGFALKRIAALVLIADIRGSKHITI